MTQLELTQPPKRRFAALPRRAVKKAAAVHVWGHAHSKEVDAEVEKLKAQWIEDNPDKSIGRELIGLRATARATLFHQAPEAEQAEAHTAAKYSKRPQTEEEM